MTGVPSPREMKYFRLSETYYLHVFAVYPVLFPMSGSPYFRSLETAATRFQQRRNSSGLFTLREHVMDQQYENILTDLNDA